MGDDILCYIFHLLANRANSVAENCGALSLISISGTPYRAKWVFSFVMTCLDVVVVKITRIIVERQQVVYSIQLRQVDSDFPSWSITIFVIVQCFFRLCRFPMRTYFACLGHLFYFTRHSGPKYCFSGPCHHAVVTRLCGM